MIDPNNIYHVYPVSDLKSHYLETNQWLDVLTCECDCEPRIENSGDGFVVIHNSFDGREGVEWVNELLKQQP